MNTLATKEKSVDNVENLKRLTTVIYVCQVAAFALAGLPLLVGLFLNFINREAVQGTWLESHFEWQIKTAWLTLAGLALAGLTFTMGVGLFILIPVLVVLIYRSVLGWTVLVVDKPMSDRN